MSSYFEDLSFVNFGYALHSTCRMDRRKFNGYYGIQFVQDGPLELGIGDSPLELYEGPFAFVTYPDVFFSYGSPSDTTRDHAHICFQGERVKRYIDSEFIVLREENPVIRLRYPEHFLHTMLNIHKHLRRPGATEHARAVLLLEDLMLQLCDQPIPITNTASLYIETFQKLRKQIADMPENNWNFESEAKNMSISYTHFRRMFRQLTGWSPGQYLLECRLRYAEQLLLGTPLRIGEIAGTCGFDDVFHFSRIFRKHRLVSPSEFRAKYAFPTK